MPENNSNYRGFSHSVDSHSADWHSADSHSDDSHSVVLAIVQFGLYIKSAKTTLCESYFIIFYYNSHSVDFEIVLVPFSIL